MPKKRNTSWSRNKKEKQIVTTRLIEISLKIDDCVYKNHVISVCEAEQYIKEVSSYKALCSRDERYLQVIEKLTRCMKAIILDHQELRTNNHTTHNGGEIVGGGDRAGSISPVYSIPDEDRTQFTQPAEEGINATVANNDVEIIDLSNIDDDDDLMHNETTTAANASSRITVEVDIHRDMSSLSLKDVEALETLNVTSSDANCSQSILNNFKGVEQMQENEINIISDDAVIVKSVDNVTDMRKTTNVMQAGNNTSTDKWLNIISNKNSISTFELNKTVVTRTNLVPNEPVISNSKTNSIVEQIKKPTSVFNTANNDATNIKKDNTKTSHIFYFATNNITKAQPKTWYDSNRTCTVNDSRHTFKDDNYSTQPNQTHKIVNPIAETKKVNLIATQTSTSTSNINAAEIGKPSINVNETSIDNKNTSITKDTATVNKKKRGPRKKKEVDEKDTKPKNKRVYRAPKMNKENTMAKSIKNNNIPIYNENVVNDLSWMENIRYVREIKVDENDTKLNLEETFWDNYYLPDNWSENEFM